MDTTAVNVVGPVRITLFCIFEKRKQNVVSLKLKLWGLWKLRRNHVPGVMEASRMSELPTARYKSGEGWGAVSYDTGGWRLPIACLCLREPISAQHMAISTPFSHSSYPFAQHSTASAMLMVYGGIRLDHLRHSTPNITSFARPLACIFL